MTFHDRRIGAARNVKSFRKRRLITQGASTINLWNAMPKIEIGSPVDDWKAVGADLRKALAEYVEERD
jgi:hypothetical protein